MFPHSSVPAWSWGIPPDVHMAHALCSPTCPWSVGPAYTPPPPLLITNPVPGFTPPARPPGCVRWAEADLLLWWLPPTHGTTFPLIPRLSMQILGLVPTPDVEVNRRILFDTLPARWCSVDRSPYDGLHPFFGQSAPYLMPGPLPRRMTPPLGSLWSGSYKPVLLTLVPHWY